MDATASDTKWAVFRDSVEELEQSLLRSRATTIVSTRLRDNARETGQFFFRQCAFELTKLGVEDDLIYHLNEATQQLLRLSNHPSSKDSYLRLVRRLRRVIDDVTVDRELKHWDRAALNAQPDALSEAESLIYETLNRLVPNASRSYRQAIIDLYDPDRISYRGVANELREALRETLDHLAPDQDVASQPGFQLERDRNTPTMKQKVRYILRARELAENAIRAPEEAVGVVEDRVASFTRATYDRSSIAAHVASEQNEVLQMKNYVNTVLAELLGLQT